MSKVRVDPTSKNSSKAISIKRKTKNVNGKDQTNAKLPVNPPKKKGIRGLGDLLRLGPNYAGDFLCSLNFFINCYYFCNYSKLIQ